MSNAKRYKFEAQGWGSLELEIINTKRDFYQPGDLAEISFNLEGFGRHKLDCEPFFFYEWQEILYSYIIDHSASLVPPFELRINDRIVNKSRVRENNHLLTGRFSFDDGVGETKIELRDSENTLIFQLNTEVFPQKMDYKSDYKAMMSDISAIIHNLAYDSLKDTFGKSRARLSGQSTENEWWNIMDALFRKLFASLNVIKNHPKHDIKKHEKVLPIEKIKSTSGKYISWLRKNSQYANTKGKGVKVAEGKYYTHALAVKKHVTYDIYENRFVAWAVKNMSEQLRHYKEHIMRVSGHDDYSPLLRRIKVYQTRLQGLLHENPYYEAGDFEKRSYFSASLTRGAGYRDFMHIYLLLTRGLELADNDIFKIEQKNISTLYEYWCFLKLVQLLKEQNSSEISYQDLIKIKANKFKVFLEKGNASMVTFRKEETGESTTIYFNKEFKREGKKVFTYNQRPDYSIEFKKKGFEQPFWYLFDAKYRFEESTGSDNNSYDVPKDAIGQMHRYRDAIMHTELSGHLSRRTMKNLGGIILYPYPLSEQEFVTNDFYESIGQTDIGALPFLPSKTALVGGLLNQMINKALPEEHFEHFIDMDRSEYLRQRDVWNKWITIGVIPKDNQEKRLKFLSEKSIYHVPYDQNSHSRLLLTKNLLICKAGTNTATLYDVKDWRFMTGSELEKAGARWSHRSEKYIAFILKKGKSLITPENLSPYKFRYITAEGLARYLQNPEAEKNYFYLTTPDAARLYEELKAREISCVIKWANDKNDPSRVKFEVKGLNIYSSEKHLDLQYKYNKELFTLKELLSIIEK